MPEKAPSLADAYERHLGLLMSALSSLAREGFAAHPSEAMDLIHDFFVEAWPSLRSRFDPSRAKFSTYLYGAFRRFARRAIARSWREASVLSSLSASPEPAMPEDPPASAADDRAALDSALASLPPRERRALSLYVGEEAGSERAVARALAVSRRAARATLVEALAKVAVRLARPEAVPFSDWRVAQCLWGAGLSVVATARTLGQTPAQVRAAQGRVLARLAEGLSRS